MKKNTLFGGIVSLPQNLLKKLLLSCFAMAVMVSSFAANISSTGTGGLWSSTASWAGGVVPGAGDNVTIVSGSSISVAAATNCTVVTINSGGRLLLTGGNLTVATTFTVNGSLDCGAFLVNGTCNFTLGSATSDTLKIGDSNGITTSGATGSIQNTGSRSFGSNSTYVYESTNAGVTQVTGNGLPASIRNLTIDRSVATDIVQPTNPITLVNASGGGGILTLNRGVFLIGTGNTFTMDGSGNGNTINNPNPTGTSNIATTGTNGSDGGTVNFASNNPVTINGPGLTTFFNLTSSTAPSIAITSAGTALINGTVTVGTGSNGHLYFIGTNGPIYGPESNLIIKWTSSSYTQGPEWNATSGYIIGTTPGYPNNVSFSGLCCTQTATFANNKNINGVLTIGDGTSTNDNNIFGANFSCGGIIINSGEKVTGPSANMIVNGSWYRAATATYLQNGGLVSFGNGLATCSTPNTINAAAGAETFVDVAIISNANVSLSVPVTVSTIALTSGILTTTPTNILTVTTASNAGITGGSNTAYINGPVKWNLGAATGLYNFPMGSGTCTPDYLPFTLNKAVGTTTATVQAFTPGSGGTGDATLSKLSTTEYWSFATSVALSSGSRISLSRSTPLPITPLDSIGQSTTATGTYTSIGGTAVANGVNTSRAISTNTSLFFTLGGLGAVSTLAATSITTTSATLNGAFNTGSSKTTSFNFGTTTAYGADSISIHSPINSATSVLDSTFVTGLTANTVYHYQATDVTDSGSDITFVTAPNPPVVGTPNTPTVDGFTATWSAPAAMGSAPYTYTIQVSTDPTFTSGVTTETGISSGSTSYVFTTLNSATQYYYRVEAVNATASSAWSATSTPISTLIAPTTPGCTTGNGSAGNPGAISKTSVLPVIDGLSDADSVWANVPANYITNESVPTQTPTTDSSRSWKAMWTTDSLYFLVQIKDPTLISQNTNAGTIGAPNTGVPVAGATPGTSGNLYDFDGVEIDLAPDGILTGGYNGVNDIQLRFNLGAPTVSGQSCGCATQFSGTIFNRVQSHVDFKVIPVTGGYNIEAAIPWGQNGANPGIDSSTSGGYNTVAAGDNIGIEVQVNDANNTAGRNFQYSWYNTSQTPYQNPTTFAEAQLLAAAACPIPPTVISPTVTNITADGATLGATVVSSGDVPTLTARGTGVSASPDTTGTSNALPEGGTAISTYSGPVRTNLLPQTKYYFIGYATNANAETGISNVGSFFTLSALPTTQPTLASCGSATNLTLNWTAVTFPPTSQATNTGYLVLRRQDGSDPTSTGIVNRIATVQGALPAGTTLVGTITSGSTQTYTDASAVTGTTYNYLLVPFTWDGIATDSTYNYFTAAAPTIATSIGGGGSTPVVTIGSISSPVDLGTQIPLVGNTTVTGSALWTVSPTTQITDSASLSTTSTPTAINSYTYTLTVTATAGGCIGTAQKTVSVVNTGCLVIPNAFTPNGDGINDTWVIQSSCYTNLTVDVYNRWGSLMYHSDNYSSANAWDGKYHGEDVPDATYYYVVKAISATDSPTKKGSLTILR